MRDEQGNNLYSIGKLADIVGIPATAQMCIRDRINVGFLVYHSAGRMNPEIVIIPNGHIHAE